MPELNVLDESKIGQKEEVNMEDGTKVEPTPEGKTGQAEAKIPEELKVDASVECKVEESKIAEENKNEQTKAVKAESLPETQTEGCKVEEDKTEAEKTVLLEENKRAVIAKKLADWEERIRCYTDKEMPVEVSDYILKAFEINNKKDNAQTFSYNTNHLYYIGNSPFEKDKFEAKLAEAIFMQLQECANNEIDSQIYQIISNRTIYLNQLATIYTRYLTNHPEAQIKNGEAEQEMLFKTTGYKIFNTWTPQDEIIHFVIDEILAQKGMLLIAGDNSIGKSFYTLWLSYCLTTGNNWCGFAIKKPYRVLYFDFEGEKSLIASRLRQLDIPQKQITFATSGPVDLLYYCEENKFRAVLDFFAPEIIIIDTYRRISNINENNSEETNRVYKKLKQIQQEYNLTIIILHHCTKISGYERKTTKQSVRGSGDITAQYDSVLLLSRDIKDGKIIVDNAKNKYRPQAKLPSFKLNYKSQPLITFIEPEQETEAVQPERLIEDEIFALISNKGSVSKEEICSIVKNYGVDSINHALSVLKKQGKITSVKDETDKRKCLYMTANTGNSVAGQESAK